MVVSSSLWLTSFPPIQMAQKDQAQRCLASLEGSADCSEDLREDIGNSRLTGYNHLTTRFQEKRVKRILEI